MTLIVYVESNFVMEIALAQEQAQAARSILALAETAQLELVFPAFSISEPIWAVAKRGEWRKSLFSSIKQSVSQLSSDLQRSELYQQEVKTFQPITTALGTMGDEERRLLRETIGRLLNAGRALETNSANFAKVLNYTDLSLQDAIVYATIVTDLQQRPLQETKCFFSRDQKAFADPAIKSELASFNCRYIDGFGNGLSFISNNLGNVSPLGQP